MFPGKKLLKNGKSNLTCKCGCVPKLLFSKFKKLDFTRKSEGVSEYWEEKGKKVCISLQGAKAPFFLLCFSIARKNTRERCVSFAFWQDKLLRSLSGGKIACNLPILYGRLEAIEKKPKQSIPGYNKIERR